MSYYGVPIESVAISTSGDVTSTLESLQIQIDLKANKSGSILTGGTVSDTPGLKDNSKAIASTEYVDRAIRSGAPDFILMAQGII